MSTTSTSTTVRRDTAKTVLPELLAIPQVAELLSISTRTVSRWRLEGKLPGYVKTGTTQQSAARYRRKDIVDWMDAGCPTPGGPAA